MHYVWRVSVLYFKNYEVNIKEQIFSLKMILAICIYWSKAQIIFISAQRPKMKKNKGTLFSRTFKVWECNLVLHLFFWASRTRYWQFMPFTILHVLNSSTSMTSSTKQHPYWDKSGLLNLSGSADWSAGQSVSQSVSQSVGRLVGWLVGRSVRNCNVWR